MSHISTPTSMTASAATAQKIPPLVPGDRVRCAVGWPRSARRRRLWAVLIWCLVVRVLRLLLVPLVPLVAVGCAHGAPCVSVSGLWVGCVCSRMCVRISKWNRHDRALGLRHRSGMTTVSSMRGWWVHVVSIGSLPFHWCPHCFRLPTRVLHHTVCVRLCDGLCRIKGCPL